MQNTQQVIYPGLLALLTIVFYLSGTLFAGFPVFIFIFLVPILALRRYFYEKRSLIPFILIFLSTFFLAFLLNNFIKEDFNIKQVFFNTFLAFFPFILVWITEKLTNPKVSSLSFLLFWITIEYAILELNLTNYEFILASAFEQRDGWVLWKKFTGFLGISLWVVIINLFLYHSFFNKDGSFVKPSAPRVFFALILIIIPVLGSFFLMDPGHSFAFGILNNYPEYFNQSEFIEKFTFYSGNKEYVGRTCAWFSLFVLLSVVVKKIMLK